jgi:hypothetical protein
MRFPASRRPSQGEARGRRAVRPAEILRRLLRAGPANTRNSVLGLSGDKLKLERYDLKLWISDPLESATYLPR